MGRKTRNGLPARVRKVRDQIALWRRTRGKRWPMPAKLWDEAVSLARTEGTYAMARALRVDYGSLARRVAEARGGGDGSAASARAFVPLSGAPFLAPAGPVVEMSDGDGVRLTIRLGTGSPLDVAGLVQRFRERRA